VLLDWFKFNITNYGYGNLTIVVTPSNNVTDGDMDMTLETEPGQIIASSTAFNGGDGK
jgi:hypothetical protein